MSTNNLPNSENWPWDFNKRRDNVGVWTMEQWDRYDQDALESVFQYYDRRTNESDLTGTVAIFDEDTDLPKKRYDYIADQWGENAWGVERVASASEGLKAMAVSATVEVENDIEVEWFSDIEEAVEWAAGK